MNAKHLSESNEHYTPAAIVEAARYVLQVIELDPASCVEANQNVKALTFITQEGNGLQMSWASEFGPRAVFLNPPGGRVQGRSSTKVWWDKLIREVYLGNVSHAVFVAFSIEALQTTQTSIKPMLDYGICIPKARVKFLKPDGTVGSSPTHASAIVYVPGTLNRDIQFYQAFRNLGHVHLAPVSETTPTR